MEKSHNHDATHTPLDTTAQARERRARRGSCEGNVIMRITFMLIIQTSAEVLVVVFTETLTMKGSQLLCGSKDAIFVLTVNFRC